ncbi:CDP-glycerol glycerophosphotransferase family protein [Konateibacter massiliensis]|uniref:CDP-glycerol glycerophosphotransferase family protein n=1 Tax=Konateibacter massiliensis TaxID=2002841 RepID=UPI000C147258|nr:CDP-glycerol glycerophosphotransferase family protein [Konateibacter massiliensis]
MKQGFWVKIKEIKIKDILHVFLFVAALPFGAVLRRRRSSMWLLCENANEARDNGYWLFRYIREKEPKQDVVYAIKRKSPDYEKVALLGEVIEFGSFRHWVYYLAAEKNVSTQKGGKPNAAVCYLLEVYEIRKNKRVFLQHGITKDNVEFLHYKNSKIQMFMCGVQREYEFVKEKFGYPAGGVRLTGMCRFDNLYHAVTDKKLILVMPTWRGWLSPPSDSNKVDGKRLEVFQETEYYKEWQGLLDDVNLIQYIEKNGYQLIFYPHREMQKFGRAFHANSHNIKIADEKNYEVQELLMSAALLITDYSSIAMDFGYMRKPQIYFQFDVSQFRKEHYEEGYFSYEKDGFGPICKERQQLVEQIVHYGSQEFSNDIEYRQRQEAFFTFYDSDNCKRNYEAIKSF